MSNKTEAGPVAPVCYCPPELLLKLDDEDYRAGWMARVKSAPNAVFSVPLYAHPPAQEHPNLACKSVQKRLATQWGYVPAQEQPAPYFNRAAVERAISSAENPAPGTMQLNDGKERVTLPGGTLRRMLAIIDQLGATRPTPAAQEQPAPAAMTKTDLARLWRGVNGSSRWPSEVDAFVGALIATHPTPAERAEQPQAEQELRELLAVRVAGALLYADDGELQDASELPAIDFKRDAPGEIARKLTDRGLKRLTRAEQPPRDAVQQGLPDEQIDALWRQAASADGFTTAQFVREFARAIERATLKGQP